MRNTTANIAAQIAQLASAFIFMPFLVRNFGLAPYGVFLLAGSVSGYLGLLDLGVGTSLVKFVAEHRTLKDDRELGRLLSSAMAFYAIIGLVVAVVLTAFALFGTGIFNLTAEGEQLARNLFVVSAAASVVGWPLSTFAYALGGLQRYDIAAKVSIVATALTALVTLAVILLNEGPIVLLVGQSAVGVAAGLWNMRIALRELGPNVPVTIRAASISTLKSISSFSGAVFVTQVASVLVYQQTDKVVLGIFVSSAAITLYEGAAKLHGLVRQSAALMSSAVMPAASSLGATENKAGLERLFVRGTKYTVAVTCPLTIAMIVLTPAMFNTWLGPQFIPVTLGAQIYMSYWLLNANTTILGGIVTGLGKVKLLLWYTIGGALANVVLSVILVQRIGMIGVIIGTVVPYYVGFPIFMYFAMRLTGLRIRPWIREVVLPTYPLLVVPAVIAWLGLQTPLANYLVGVLALLGLSVTAYLGALYLTGLDAAEKDDVRKLVTAVRGRLSRRPATS